jgi:hypothetical protein
MTTYRLDIVTSGIPEPLHTKTFEAIHEFDATTTARRYTRELVGNPEEERGELYAGDEHVATISLARDEEDAR